jgi:hypothetical protein
MSTMSHADTWGRFNRAAIRAMWTGKDYQAISLSRYRTISLSDIGLSDYLRIIELSGY